MPRPKRSHDDCPYEATVQALKCIGGRWKPRVLRRLLEAGPAGFNDLRRAIEGVSAKMLTQQLRELEDDGLVAREVLTPDPPMTVRYTLTPLGERLGPVLHELAAWGEAWLHHAGRGRPAGPEIDSPPRA